MKMRSARLISLMTAAAFLSGCATIFTGGDQQIAVHTQPEGALCKADGARQFRTPASILLDRASSHHITCVKEGYAAARGIVNNLDFNPVFWVDLIFLPGMIVDAVTGADSELSPATLYLQLVASQQSSPASDQGEAVPTSGSPPTGQPEPPPY